jgi:outer membrane protein assembly factor BamB
VQFVPPFQTREYCRTYTAPRGAEIFNLSSHTHRWGDLFRIWAPPNAPCTPGPTCQPRLDEPIYYSTDYTDPVQLNIEPPFLHPDADVESRTYLYCSVYDNAATLSSSGGERHPVKRQSTSPEPPLVFGLPLGPGGPCPDTHAFPFLGVYCINGPRQGLLCHGNDSECDSAPGVGDGVCDACPVRGGVTTEDEMFIMLGSFYIDDGSSSGTEITTDNVSALSVKWEFPLAGGVTSSPVVTETFVYATSWDGKVYALNKENGEEVWSFDTGASVALGVQATVTLGPGGQVIVGDSLSTLRMLDGKTGDVIWSRLLGNPAVDHIWGAATVANSRIFVGLASHSDNPCTNGRLVALDLETGNLLWSRQNVPEGVCSNDTSRECSQDSHCGGGSCLDAVGAGVTAQPAVDASGDYVYVNTVGCYTFPSVGDSDAMMKLDAATGATEWVTRVDAPEQFGFCADARDVECSTTDHCGGGTCTTKPFYHDFGFLNGPTVVEVDDGFGGTRTLLVSGSKNGTLYAFDESDGSIVWSNAVQPTPVSPGFAGFGLFNGGLDYADGRFYAALFQLASPAPPVEHLMSFDENDGSIVWSDEIGPAWANPSVSNGVLFTGANSQPVLYAYDAETGQRLAAFSLPAPSSSKAAVDGTSVYVGYGIFGAVGGVRAYILP